MSRSARQEPKNYKTEGQEVGVSLERDNVSSQILPNAETRSLTPNHLLRRFKCVTKIQATHPDRDREAIDRKDNLPHSATTAKNHGHPPKSAMSCMELMKHHQSLLMEKEGLMKSSEQKESQRQALVSQFAHEIQQYKENHAVLKEEMNFCKVWVDERHQVLNLLQQNLDEIKFENERMAAVVECTRIHSLTGEQIKVAEKT